MKIVCFEEFLLCKNRITRESSGIDLSRNDVNSYQAFTWRRAFDVFGAIILLFITLTFSTLTV